MWFHSGLLRSCLCNDLCRTDASFQSPALLQLSGVGDSDVLGPLGINTHIDLKTVGKNLQEQVSTCHHHAHIT